MLETLLSRQSGINRVGPILYIDFSDVALSTKTIIDKAQGITFALQGAVGSTNTN